MNIFESRSPRKRKRDFEIEEELSSMTLSSGSSRGGGGGTGNKDKSVNLISSLLSRQLLAVKTPTWTMLNKPCYRPFIRNMYRRASVNPKRVFRAPYSWDEGDINPINDLQFSPVAYHDHRVIAVGDEKGYLSVVKVGFDGAARRGGGRSKTFGLGMDDGGGGGRVVNRGVEYSGTQQPQQRSNDSFGNEEAEAPAGVQPDLNCLAWSWDGERILTGYGNGSIRIWDLIRSSTPTCVATIYAYDKSLKRVSWCQDTLVSCSQTNEIIVHDLRMRNPLSNKIDCSQLSSKLTDLSIVSDVHVLACSSNQSSVHLFDLRHNNKMQKYIKSVQSFDLCSPGYTTIKYDRLADDGMVYALGSDSIIRSIDYRTGDVGPTYQVPGGVDFFTRIDVDKFSGILVSGGKCDRAFGYDLEMGKATHGNGGQHVMPFFELNEGRKPPGEGHRPDEVDAESDKENQPEEVDGGLSEDDDEVTDSLRSCSAVALGTRRSFQDCAFQIACGGDNSEVVIYE